jgi:hypothetical protein
VKRLPVVALDAVRNDVQAAYEYFEARGHGAGEKFLGRYFTITDRISLNPETFPVKFDDYRRALIPKSYLAAYYFIESERGRGDRGRRCPPTPSPDSRPCTWTKIVIRVVSFSFSKSPCFPVFASST